MTDKSLYREPRKSGWTDVIPEQIVQLSGWRAEVIEGPQKVLILSDLHIPFHDPESLEIALEYGAGQRPTMILLNGDIGDFYAASRWETDPRMRDFPGEIRSIRYFLSGLRKRFPKERILFKEGNHESRLTKYLRLKCPELLGIPEFDWENILGLPDLKIQIVKDMRPILLGKLNVIHGHEFVFQISSPVNPARGFFLRAKTHCLGGHFHRTSQHSEKSLDDKVLSAWSTGCLCDLHPAYFPINSWNHGAAIVDVDEDGGFSIENFRIINGRIW